MTQSWRTIRVFISSTFRDMQAERDHLVRFVFPRLREELRARRMHLVEVDLRWGVTSDQDAFELCMDEIDRCRPRFLGLLGGRYGWVPPPRDVEAPFFEGLIAGQSPAGELPVEHRMVLEWLYERSRGTDIYRLREKPAEPSAVEAWLRDGVVAVEILQRAELPAAKRSITAAEILYGALENLDRPAFRYFCFRNPAVTGSIPEPHAREYREPEGSPAAEALADLKQRVRDSTGRVLIAPNEVAQAPLPVFVYPCRWDERTARVTDLEAFGERVHTDLLASVDAEFGPFEPGVLDEFTEERAATDVFIESRTERYVVGSRAPVFASLEEHAAARGGNGCLCVVGEPGSGKSALLAEFYRRYTTAHPDHLVIPHFVGASAASTALRPLLRRLCYELVTGADLEETIPDDLDELRKALPELLDKAASRHHVVIMIDAVNQLDPAHQAHALRWLPEALPENARVVISTLAGPVLDALMNRREPPVLEPLGALEEQDQTSIMDAFLGRYRKMLDATQRAALLAKPAAGTPLYLLTALEELRTLGTYAEITDRIRELPGDVKQLFLWILGRLEQDPGFRSEEDQLIGTELVRRYTSYLASGRAGMAERELAELVAQVDQAQSNTADRLGNAAALQRLLRPYLMSRGELLDFFHGQLREAVEERYLHDPAQRVAAHREIGQYLRRLADPAEDASWTGGASYPRSVSELPYHLTEAQMWDELHAVLTDLGFLEAKCTHVAVQHTGSGAEARTVYGGVYELQEDYRRALEVLPAE